MRLLARATLLTLLTACMLGAIWLLPGSTSRSDPRAARSAGGQHDVQPLPAFTGRRGVGGIKTFAFPKETFPGSGDYVARPYLPPWEEEMLGGRLAELRRAGFDFIRINVHPGPLLSASPAALRVRLGEIDFAVRSSLQAGLKVVLDIHVPHSDPRWSSDRITSGVNTNEFGRYLTVVEALAGLVSTYNPERVALELFNEPPPPCVWTDRAGWPQQLQLIHRAARRSAPRHTLIVAGACYASISGLLLLDGSRFDTNTMFAIHFYEPHVFTHQGYWGSSDAFMPFVAPLPYPPTNAMIAPALARIEQGLTKAGRSAVDTKGEMAKAKRRLERYAAEYSQSDWMRARFAEALAWARKYRISPRAIMLSEFGAMKDIYGKIGARPHDRQRWLSAVRTVAEESGFAWSVWALTNSMGIVTGDVDGPLDAGVLRALGLHVPSQ